LEISPQFLTIAVILTVFLLIIWKFTSLKIEQKFTT
jgi:hypothetical protein